MVGRPKRHGAGKQNFVPPLPPSRMEKNHPARNDRYREGDDYCFFCMLAVHFYCNTHSWKALVNGQELFGPCNRAAVACQPTEIRETRNSHEASEAGNSTGSTKGQAVNPRRGSTTTCTECIPDHESGWQKNDQSLLSSMPPNDLHGHESTAVLWFMTGRQSSLAMSIALKSHQLARKPGFFIYHRKNGTEAASCQKNVERKHH